jgi:hypothetical protein
VTVPDCLIALTAAAPAGVKLSVHGGRQRTGTGCFCRPPTAPLLVSSMVMSTPIAGFNQQRETMIGTNMVTSEGVVYFNDGAGAFTDSTEHWMPCSAVPQPTWTRMGLLPHQRHGAAQQNRSKDNSLRQPQLPAHERIDLATGDLMPIGDLD